MIAHVYSSRNPQVDFALYLCIWMISISLAAQKGLSMHLMDVVSAFLYRSLDSDIYTKVPEGLDIPNKNHSRNMYCVKLQKSLYGLKQSGRMW